MLKSAIIPLQHTLQTNIGNKYKVIEKGNLQYIKPSFQFKSSTSLEYRILKPGEPTKVSTKAFMRIERVGFRQNDDCTDL